MNERIEKLVRQAGLTQAKDFKSGDEVKNFVFGNGLEKFAELIVRECVSIAHPQLKDVGEWAAGMRLAQKRIKEHFGVEE
jgi:hypothetical protein